MTTHAARTDWYHAPCGTCRTEATYHVTSEGGMDVHCGTCDPPPEPRPDRYLRDVDAHLRRRA